MSLLEKARPGGAPPEDDDYPRRGRRRLPVLLLVLLVAALGALWWLREREQTVEPVELAPVEEPVVEPPPLGAREPAPLVEPEAPAPEAALVAPPKAAVELPPLADSDALARELAGDASKSTLLAAALKEAGVIERFVGIVDSVAEGKAPRRELGFLRPKGAFGVLGAEPEQRIDPASYRRYDALAEAIATIDARAAAAAYRRLAPLCEESYRALGYPEGGFEHRLRSAIALLLSTPILDEDPAVVVETKRFEFADAELESLSDAQKQLLRMGPANAKRVTAKLREIEAALGG